jgi:hypothetical protein
MTPVLTGPDKTALVRVSARDPAFCALTLPRVIMTLRCLVDLETPP